MSDSSSTEPNNGPSGLILPGDNGFKNPGAKGRQKGKATPPPPESEDIELYPSEHNAVRVLAADIQRKYGWKPFTDSTSTQFENEVTQRFAEECGIVVKLYWKDVDVDDDTNSDTLYFIPTIAMVGRTERKSIDHEQMAREIQSGELDGKKGTIRPDGTFGDATRTQL